MNYSSLWTQYDNDIGKENLNNEYIEEENFCEHCKSIMKQTEEGYLCCDNIECSKISKNKLDFTAEWRYFNENLANSDPSRCGMPINPYLVETSFACRIVCNQNSSYEMRKIRRYTEWQSMPYKEKSKNEDFQYITYIANNAGFSKSIIQDAIKYYDKLYDSTSFRGSNRDSLLSSSLYIACSVNNIHRTSKEIAKIFKLDNKSSATGCKNAVSILNELEKDYKEEDKTLLQDTNPSTFIERYCSKLSLNNELIKLCIFISKIVENKNLIPENTPHSVSVGIIYFVCKHLNLNVTKKSIKNITNISEVTINKCNKKLDLYYDELIPKSILNKYNKS